jgi:hypothetical protein
MWADVNALLKQLSQFELKETAITPLLSTGIAGLLPFLLILACPLMMVWMMKACTAATAVARDRMRRNRASR